MYDRETPMTEEKKRQIQNIRLFENKPELKLAFEDIITNSTYLTSMAFCVLRTSKDCINEKNYRSLKWYIQNMNDSLEIIKKEFEQ